MEEEYNTNPGGTSVEMGQAAEAPAEGESSRTRQDSFYADRRRKEQLEAAREEIASLKRQIARYSPADNPPEESGAEDSPRENIPAESEAGESPDTAPEISGEEAELEQEALRRLDRVESRINFYRQRQVNSLMEKDLREIQQIAPGITSLADLPPEYLALRFNTVSPLTARQAYAALGRIEKALAGAKPRSTGSLSDGAGAQAEYYTAEELDMLTAKQLSNPAVMEKAMKSLSRLK